MEFVSKIKNVALKLVMSVSITLIVIILIVIWILIILTTFLTAIKSLATWVILNAECNL